MAEIDFKMTGYFLYTPLSNVFIDKYMTKANPAFVSVYIFFLRHALSGVYINTSQAAEKLNILESDVINALKYWGKNNVINIQFDNENIKIEFLDLNKSLNNTKIETKTETDKKVYKETKPSYSDDEIRFYSQQNQDVKQLFNMAQRILAKPLSSNDMSVLISLYDWLRMPLDEIAVLLTYCAENGKGNMRYIEKTAVDWNNKGIDTAEKAEEYLKNFNTDFKEIMKYFGISNRTPTEAEQKYMTKWVNVFKMKKDIIKIACERTVIKTGQASFPYADSIVSKWYEAGVSSAADIVKIDEEFNFNRNSEKNKNVENNYNAVKSVPKPNRFVNFEQREWDFDELKRRERERMYKNLEG